MKSLQNNIIVAGYLKIKATQPTASSDCSNRVTSHKIKHNLQSYNKIVQSILNLKNGHASLRFKISLFYFEIILNVCLLLFLTNSFLRQHVHFTQ